jgi:hypothetical protein
MKIILKHKALRTALFIVLAVVTNAAFAQQKFDKAAFYKVMDTGNVAAIDAEVDVVKASGVAAKDGYEGALLMRKAGKVALPAQKLKFFKAGRIKLETAIQADADNTELRFLRLAIEEHAPKIVKYKSDIEKDKAFILKNYKTLPESVQSAIKDYTQKSKVLRAEDLN